MKELEGELEITQEVGDVQSSDRASDPSKSRDFTPLKADPEDASQEPPSSAASSTNGDSDIEKLIAPTKKLMVASFRLVLPRS